MRHRAKDTGVMEDKDTGAMEDKDTGVMADKDTGVMADKDTGLKERPAIQVETNFTLILNKIKTFT